MEVLIREIRTNADGLQQVTDKEFSGDVITLGSAPNQVIQLIGLNVSREHATISLTEQGIRLTCTASDLSVTVNNGSVNAVTLNRGDTILIGAHRLRLVAAPAGFNLAIEVQLNAKVDSSEFEGAFQTELRASGLSKRRMAWLSSLVILAVFLLLPLFFFGVRHFVNIPDVFHADRLWSPGPLAPGHAHAIGNDCKACHTTLFVPVRDTQCLTCHKSSVDHVTPEHLTLTTLGRKPSCESCHREHAEPIPVLISKIDSECKHCHANSTKTFGSLNVKEVDGFNSKDHPEFTLHIHGSVKLKGDRVAAGAVEWHEMLAVPGKATEDLNLKFPHAVHLDGARVTRLNDSKPLSCMDCHVMRDDGGKFKPIIMKSACIDCHDLAFDPTNPARQLPHGKPREVVTMLQEYYSAKYLDPNAARAAIVERRRIPGRDDDQAGCEGPPLVCARQEAARQINIQFNVRGCVTCHQIIDTQSPELVDRYQVIPVRMSSDYYPSAQFNHRSHLIQGSLSGDDACNSCHGARASTQSTDVLVPGIGNCVLCHSNRSADRKAPSETLSAITGRGDNIKLGCSDCHQYHPVRQ